MRLTRRGVLQAVASTSVAMTAPTLGNTATSFDWDGADATAMAQAVSDGRVSAQELLEEAIQRLGRVNPQLNLLAQDHIELARASVKTGHQDGPFRGVPFLLKDLGARLAGTVTSSGSVLERDNVAKTDTTLVARFKDAGLNIFGKTNTPEYGLALTTEGRHLGDCLNPWDLTRSTGGSSGGSAAAVAAGVVPMAHASDGGGSIRVPANHCGGFGLKPTRGLTPGALGAAMSVNHVITRSVRDSALMLEAISGYEPGAPFGLGLPTTGFFAATLRSPKPLRIALNLTEPNVPVDEDVRSSVIATAKLLELLGHQVEEATPGIDYENLNAIQNTLVASGTAAWLEFLESSRGALIAEDELEPMTHMVRVAGNAYSGIEVASATAQMHQLGLLMGRFHATYDLVLQPVTSQPAPKLGTITYRDGDSLKMYTERFKQISAYTHLYNMTGQPSMSVPLGQSRDGLPIGIMLSASVGNDALLLAVAAQLERAEPWISRRPSIYSA